MTLDDKRIDYWRARSGDETNLHVPNSSARELDAKRVPATRFGQRHTWKCLDRRRSYNTAYTSIIHNPYLPAVLVRLATV